MKSKIPGISGLGIAILLLVNLLLPDIPASARGEVWEAETIPSTTYEVLGPAGIDVQDIAVTDGSIIYAVTGDSVLENILYKSTDAGISWTTREAPIQADLVAVAPDNPDVVAIASSRLP